VQGCLAAAACRNSVGTAIDGFSVTCTLPSCSCPSSGRQAPQLEQLCAPDAMFSIDITATTADGVRLAVEADGSFHFRQPPDSSLMGPTLFRNRALAARGYTVVSVPFYEWDRLHFDRQKQQWLARQVPGKT